MKLYNIALVLIRFLGLIGLLFGAQWLVYFALVFRLTASGMPKWIMSSASGVPPEWIMATMWSYAAHGFLAGPIWLMVGIVLLRFSRQLAMLLTKDIERHGD